MFSETCFYIREWGLLPLRTKSVLIFETSKLADEPVESFRTLYLRSMKMYSRVACLVIPPLQL